jgi:hypothetical protein
MKTVKYYFVNFATCNDGIFRDCCMFNRLSEAKAFASTLAYKWEIRRRVDAPFIVLEDSVIARSVDPNAKYRAIAQKAAQRLARSFKAA